MSVIFKNGQALALGGTLAMQDGAGVAVKSPQTIGAASKDITIPTDAVAILLYTATEAIDIAADTGFTAGLMRLPAGSTHRLPCAGHTNLYFRAAANTDSLYFAFETA